MIKWKTHNRYFLTNLVTTGKLTDEEYAEKEPNYRLELERDEQYICTNHMFPLYKTNYETLYVRILKGGFDMHSGDKKKLPGGGNEIRYDPTINHFATGTPVNNETNPLTLQGRIASTQHKSQQAIQMNILKTESTKDFWHPNGKINYDTHINVKLDYLFHQHVQMLRASELEMMTNICELERTQILTILAIAAENSQLAGYLLTNNRSNFITTDGSIAYMYQCDERKSPIFEQTKCYDRIPVFYMDELWFIDPITRHTHSGANEVDCQGQIQNLFHFDLDDPESWYRLVPYIDKNDPPNYFEAKQAKYITPYNGESAGHAGLYNQRAVQSFWGRIQTNINEMEQVRKFKTALGNYFAQGAHKPSESVFHGGFFGTGGPVFLDGLMSPSFFKDEFIKCFGFIAYYWTLTGTAFAGFLFVKFLLDVIMTIIRTLEINKITKNTMSWGKVVFGSIFNVFYLSAITSVYGTEEKPTYPRAIEMQDYKMQIAPPIYNETFNPSNTHIRYPQIYPPQHSPYYRVIPQMDRGNTSDTEQQQANEDSQTQTNNNAEQQIHQNRAGGSNQQ